MSCMWLCLSYARVLARCVLPRGCIAVVVLGLLDDRSRSLRGGAPAALIYSGSRVT